MNRGSSITARDPHHDRPFRNALIAAGQKGSGCARIRPWRLFLCRGFQPLNRSVKLRSWLRCVATQAQTRPVTPQTALTSENPGQNDREPDPTPPSKRTKKRTAKRTQRNTKRRLGGRFLRVPEL